MWTEWRRLVSLEMQEQEELKGEDDVTLSLMIIRTSNVSSDNILNKHQMNGVTLSIIGIISFAERIS